MTALKLQAKQRLVESAPAAKGAKVWKTDRQMDKLVGKWWSNEMEVGDFVSMKAVKDANAELKRRGHDKKVKVFDCRENKSGDYMDWLVQEL